MGNRYTAFNISIRIRIRLISTLILNPDPNTKNLIHGTYKDNNAEHVAHVCRKTGIFGNKIQICDCSRSIFVGAPISELPSNACNPFLAPSKVCLGLLRLAPDFGGKPRVYTPITRYQGCIFQDSNKR